MAPPKPGFSAFTVRAQGGRLRELRTQCGVCPSFDPLKTPKANHPNVPAFSALWDTGATGSVITAKVVTACGLQPVGMQRTQGAYGGVPVDRCTYLINLVLPNGVLCGPLTVGLGEMAGVDVLIGMDIITLGDFAITHENAETVFSFRIPSLHTIDYAAQQTRQMAAQQQSQPNARRPRDYLKSKR